MYYKTLSLLAIIYLSIVYFWVAFLPEDFSQVSDHDLKNLDKQTKCLAQAVYYEARGEPLKGQIAVAQVVRNRVVTSKKPTTLCKIVFAGSNRRHACQFSFACDGKSDKPKDMSSWKKSVRIAKLVVTGNLSDFSGEATHYHATYVNPHWAKSLKVTKNIGRHIFYR